MEKFMQISKNKYLYEGLNLSDRNSVLLWETAGRKIIEANLTADQINQIFTSVEQGATAAGGNRTLIGQGKDVASAVNKAWEDLKTKVQNSGPIQKVDAMYDQAAEKLKQATGGDQGVMKYVQKYRDFAKKHPIAQSLIYSALIAAAGISGAGLGGAAALGLFKMVDKLLQGEKFSSAAYQGAKTGAMAYGASKVGDYIKGKMSGDAQSPTADQFTQNRGAASGDMKPGDYDNMSQVPSNPDGSPMSLDQVNAAKDAQLQAGGNVAGKAAGAAINARSEATTAGLNAVKDAMAKGEVRPSALEEIAKAAMEKYSTLGGGKLNPSTIEALAAQAAEMAKSQATNENISLTSKQINLIFEHVSDSLLLEGIMDFAKGAIGKGLDWAQTKGKNLTTKVTADKLQQSWKKAGSPTDSEAVSKILSDAGVSADIISTAFKSVGVDSSAGNTNDQEINIKDLLSQILKLDKSAQQEILNLVKS